MSDKFLKWTDAHGREHRASYVDGEVVIEAMGRSGFGDISRETPGEWSRVEIVRCNAISAVLGLSKIDPEMLADYGKE